MRILVFHLLTVDWGTTVTPWSENLAPLTVVVVAGSGWTPRGLAVEWSRYQRAIWACWLGLTSLVTSLKNCLWEASASGRLSWGVL